MDCMGQAPASLDEWFAIIDRCATFYGGARWEVQALSGLVALALALLALVLVVMAVRSVAR